MLLIYRKLMHSNTNSNGDIVNGFFNRAVVISTCAKKAMVSASYSGDADFRRIAYHGARFSSCTIHLYSVLTKMVFFCIF